MKKIILSLAAIGLLVSSCGDKEPARIERVFEANVNLENDYINIDNTKKQYNAHSGEYYSGIDTSMKYGAGYVKKIQDSLRGYNLNLVVSAWLREFSEPADGAVAVSVNLKDGKAKDWTGLKVKPENFKAKEWIYVTDTFRYNSDFMKDVDEIKIFSMKVEGGDMLDVDDLKIKYIFYK